MSSLGSRDGQPATTATLFIVSQRHKRSRRILTMGEGLTRRARPISIPPRPHASSPRPIFAPTTPSPTAPENAKSRLLKEAVTARRRRRRRGGGPRSALALLQCDSPAPSYSSSSLCPVETAEPAAAESVSVRAASGVECSGERSELDVERKQPMPS